MRLLHGDCLDLLPRIPDGSVSMVFADLPYAHMNGGKVRKCTANAWDAPIDLEALWTELLRVGKPNAAFVFTATFKFACALERSAPKGMSCYDVIWKKGKTTGFMNAKRQPLRQHEGVYVFTFAQPTYNPQMTAAKTPNYGLKKQTRAGSNYQGEVNAPVADSGLRYPTSVFECAAVRGQDIVHPTQKPVALLEWLVKTYTNPGDTVLDPTAGSFTTGVACVNTGRDFIGIEKDASYFEIGQRRVMAAQPPLPGAA